MTNPFAAATATAPATPPAPAPAAAPTVNPFAAQQAAAPAAPVAQQYAAPAPAAPVAQQFASPAAAAAPALGDPFAGPAPQEPRGPRLREMYGRLLLILPSKLETGVVSRTFRNPDGSAVIQDRMTADVIVLDGGPINYGGKPEAKVPTPHDKVAQVPHKNRAMFISSVGLISQCREALAKRLTGQPGAMVLGRLTVGEDSGKGEPPWLLLPPTEEDKAVARAYLQTVDPFSAA